LDGEITCSSSLSVGSTFKVRIKIKEGKAEIPKSKMDNRQVIGLSPDQIIPKILIAEDKEENRQLLVNILKPIGFDIRKAVDGKEAVEICKQWKPDLIWMDIRMPVMDGLEATRIIKASEQGKLTKIVAISAHALDEERKEIFDAGCDDFVGKPFKINELFEIMGKHLDLAYVYEEISAENEIKSLNTDVTLDLGPLGAELFAELSAAVDKTDATRIEEIAEQLKITEPALADSLHICARNFDYETIRIALQNETLRVVENPRNG